MPHRHVLAQLALVAAYLVILHFAVDVIAGGFPENKTVRGFKQAVTD